MGLFAATGQHAFLMPLSNKSLICSYVTSSFAVTGQQASLLHQGSMLLCCHRAMGLIVATEQHVQLLPQIAKIFCCSEPQSHRAAGFFLAAAAQWAFVLPMSRRVFAAAEHQAILLPHTGGVFRCHLAAGFFAALGQVLFFLSH